MKWKQISKFSSFQSLLSQRLDIIHFIPCKESHVYTNKYLGFIKPKYNLLYIYMGILLKYLLPSDILIRIIYW